MFTDSLKRCALEWSWKVCFIASFGIVDFCIAGSFDFSSCLDDWNAGLSHGV